MCTSDVPKKRVEPVLARARAVSVPRPEEQPVMRIVLWGRVFSRDWVVIMSQAVGEGSAILVYLCCE